MPTVCAIIPTYNRAHYLCETLDSLLNQTRPLDNIIIVNDGSTDGTRAAVAPYLADPRIRLITKENGGKSSALNVGLAACTSDYVWICDDDDIALPEGLAHLVSALEAHPEAGLAYGRYRFLYETSGIRTYGEQTYWPRDAEPSAKIRFLEAMFTNQFAILVRRSLYEEVGHFPVDLIWSEDTEMLIRLTRHHSAVSVPHVIFLYRQHEGVRGTAKESTAEHKRVMRWLEAGQHILGAVRARYSLEEFTPTFARNWDPKSRERACALQRACIMAHNSLWLEAASDIVQAGSAAGGCLPSPEEEHLAGWAVFHDIHWVYLATRAPDAVRELAACTALSAYNRAILYAMFLRVPRMILRKAVRQGNLGEGLSLLKTMFVILGPVHAARRCVSSVLSRGARGHPNHPG